MLRHARSRSTLLAIGLLALAVCVFLLPERPVTSVKAGDPIGECPIDYQLGENCPSGGSPGGGGPGGVGGGSGSQSGSGSAPGFEGPPEDLSFDDDGSVVFTTRLDPAQEATRDRVLVDPASGALTFRIPLAHKIRGRNHDVNLEMIYRSNFQQKSGKFGAAGWTINLWKLLVIDTVIPREECNPDPVLTDLKGLINATPQITQFDGEKGAIVWSNRESILGTGAFMSQGPVGIPSGNLAGGIRMSVPTGIMGLGGDYEIEPEDVCNSYGQVMTPDLNPREAGIFAEAEARPTITEFVPPVGVQAVMKIDCDGIWIRDESGVITKFTTPRKKREDQVVMAPTGQVGSGDPPDSVRVQLISVPSKMIFPDGGEWQFYYNSDGRLVSIIDEFGRTAVRFYYEGQLSNRIVRIEDYPDGSTPRSTTFQYHTTAKTLESITTPLASGLQQWKFETVADWVFDTAQEELRPEITELQVPMEFKVWQPGDPANLPVIHAMFEPVADPDLTDREMPEVGRVTDLFLGGYYEADHGITVNVAGESYEFEVGQHINYSYSTVANPQFPCLGDSVVTIADSDGLVKKQTFDWQSREIERRDVGMGPGGTDIVTTFVYQGEYPYITETIDPRGNTVIESYGFQAAEALGKSYFTVAEEMGEVARDRFAEGNVLERTWTSYFTDPDYGDQLAHTEIVETYLYEPYLNQVRQITDGRGNTTTHVYDYQESPNLAFTNMLDYWAIDYSEISSDSSAWGLGDQNGDCVQSQRFGNHIRTDLPDVTGGLTAEVEGGTQSAYEATAYNDASQVIWTRDGEGRYTTHEYYSESDPNADAGAPYTGYLRATVVDAEPPGGSDPDALEIRTEYGYDEIGRPLWEKNPRGFHTVRAFDGANRTLWEVSGNVDEFGVPAMGAEDWTRREFEYNLHDRKVLERERNNDPATANHAGLDTPGYVTTWFGYDLLDHARVVATELVNPDSTDPIQVLRHLYHYDGNGNVVKAVTPELRVTQFVYDELSRVVEKRSYLTLDTTTGAKEADSFPTQDPMDPVTLFDYDANSNLLQVSVLGADDQSTSDDIVHTMVYDGFDRRRALLSPENMSVEHWHDRNGNVVEVKKRGPRNASDTVASGLYPLLSRVAYQYDERDRLESAATDFFEWVHDGSSWTQESRGANGTAALEYGYDRRSLAVAERDDLGRTSYIEYDGAGRESRRFLPLVGGYTTPNERTRTYDAMGNLVEERKLEVSIEASMEVVDEFLKTFDYDALDRMTLETREPNEASPIVMAYEYSSLGDQTGSWNPNGVGTKSLFDTQHREVVTRSGYDNDFDETTGIIVGSDNPDGFIETSRVYDGDGKLRFQYDDNAEATEIRYDGVGRERLLIQADGTRQRTRYKRNGPIDDETRFDGQTVLYFASYVYDGANRKTMSSFQSDPAEIALSGVHTEVFEYDGLSRIVQAGADSLVPWFADWEFQSTITKSYDSMGNVRSDVQSMALARGALPTLSLADVVRSDYDTIGNETSVEIGQAGSPSYVRQLSFDALNRIDTISDGTSVLHDFSYLGSGYRLDQVTHGNGASSHIGRSGYDAFRRISEMRYEDPSNNLQTQLQYSYDLVGNQLTESRPLATAKSKTYEYDAANRLVTYKLGTPAVTMETFGLDGVGNWKDHLKGGVTYENDVNEVHEYVTDFDSKAVTYDDWGNLVEFGNDDYVFDAKGRIVGAEVDGIKYLYAYDAQGRRVFANDMFVTHSKEREIRQSRYLDGTPYETFTYGNALDEVLSFTRFAADGTTETGRYFLQKNRNGSVMALTGAAGTVVERYEYTPYGEHVTEDTDADQAFIESTFLFGGRRYDAETGLYFMRARSYHPEMGRFMARDQIGFYGDANNWGNPYAYGGNNPLSGFDPSGNGWFSRLVSSTRNFVGGAIDGAINGATFGLVESSVGAAITGADTSSAAYTAGTIVGGVAGAAVTTAATAGATGAIGATLRGGQLVGELNDAVGTVKAAVDIASGRGTPGDFIAVATGGSSSRRGTDAPSSSTRGAGANSSGRNEIGGCGTTGCFVAGTVVHTAEGPVSIETVEAGDEVISFDAEEGEWTTSTVEQAFSRSFDGVLVTIELSNGDSLEATDTHPFWVTDGMDLGERPSSTHVSFTESVFVSLSGARWVEASDLRVGDCLVDRDGGRVRVLSVASRPVGLTVHNMVVTGTHSYAVGDVGVATHNAGAKCPPDAGGSSEPKSSSAARREVMRSEGIPTSQQPKSQDSHWGRGHTPAGRELVYDTPEGPKHVQHQLADRDHGPHWEAGKPKEGGQTDSVGRRRLSNDKSKADHD